LTVDNTIVQDELMVDDFQYNFVPGQPTDFDPIQTEPIPEDSSESEDEVAADIAVLDDEEAKIADFEINNKLKEHEDQIIVLDGTL